MSPLGMNKGRCDLGAPHISPRPSTEDQTQATHSNVAAHHSQE